MFLITALYFCHYDEWKAKASKKILLGAIPYSFSISSDFSVKVNTEIRLTFEILLSNALGQHIEPQT